MAEARLGRDALRRVLRLAFVYLVVPVLAYLLLVTLAAPALLDLLFGDKYVAYSPAVGLFALQYGLWFLYFPFQVGLKALQRTRPIFIAHGLAIVAMFTLGIAMIRLLGVYGAVFGQVLNALIALIVIGLAWRRESRAAIPGAAPGPDEAQTGSLSRGLEVC